MFNGGNIWFKFLKLLPHTPFLLRLLLPFPASWYNSSCFIFVILNLPSPRSLYPSFYTTGSFCEILASSEKRTSPADTLDKVGGKSSYTSVIESRKIFRAISSGRLIIVGIHMDRRIYYPRDLTHLSR